MKMFWIIIWFLSWSEFKSHETNYLHDTSATDAAVMSSNGLKCFASFAESAIFVNTAEQFIRDINFLFYERGRSSNNNISDKTIFFQEI